jgi:hypothetical protein
MKYLVYDQDYDYVQFFKICDSKKQAEAYVAKYGYGTIEEIDDVVDIDEIIHYHGSCTVHNFEFDPEQLSIGGHDLSDDNEEGFVSCDRYGDNLYFRMRYIAAKSIDEVRSTVIPQIEAMIEVERKMPTPPEPKRAFICGSGTTPGYRQPPIALSGIPAIHCSG